MHAEMTEGWKKLPSGGWALEVGNRKVTLHKRQSGVYPWVIERLTHIGVELKRRWIPIKPLVTFMDESEARAFGEKFVKPRRRRSAGGGVVNGDTKRL